MALRNTRNPNTLRQTSQRPQSSYVQPTPIITQSSSYNNYNFNDLSRVNQVKLIRQIAKDYTAGLIDRATYENAKKQYKKARDYYRAERKESKAKYDNLKQQLEINAQIEAKTEAQRKAIQEQNRPLTKFEQKYGKSGEKKVIDISKRVGLDTPKYVSLQEAVRYQDYIYRKPDSPTSIRERVKEIDTTIKQSTFKSSPYIRSLKQEKQAILQQKDFLLSKQEGLIEEYKAPTIPTKLKTILDRNTNAISNIDTSAKYYVPSAKAKRVEVIKALKQGKQRITQLLEKKRREQGSTSKADGTSKYLNIYDKSPKKLKDLVNRSVLVNNELKKIASKLSKADLKKLGGKDAPDRINKLLDAVALKLEKEQSKVDVKNPLKFGSKYKYAGKDASANRKAVAESVLIGAGNVLVFGGNVLLRPAKTGKEILTAVSTPVKTTTSEIARLKKNPITYGSEFFFFDAGINAGKVLVPKEIKITKKIELAKDKTKQIFNKPIEKISNTKSGRLIKTVFKDVNKVDNIISDRLNLENKFIDKSNTNSYMKNNIKQILNPVEDIKNTAKKLPEKLEDFYNKNIEKVLGGRIILTEEYIASYKIRQKVKNKIQNNKIKPNKTKSYKKNIKNKVKSNKDFTYKPKYNKLKRSRRGFTKSEIAKYKIFEENKIIDLENIRLDYINKERSKEIKLLGKENKSTKRKSNKLRVPRRVYNKPVLKTRLRRGTIINESIDIIDTNRPIKIEFVKQKPIINERINIKLNRKPDKYNSLNIKKEYKDIFDKEIREVLSPEQIILDRKLTVDYIYFKKTGEKRYITRGEDNKNIIKEREQRQKLEDQAYILEKDKEINLYKNKLTFDKKYYEETGKKRYVTNEEYANNIEKQRKQKQKLEDQSYILEKDKEIRLDQRRNQEEPKDTNLFKKKSLKDKIKERLKVYKSIMSNDIKSSLDIKKEYRDIFDRKVIDIEKLSFAEQLEKNIIEDNRRKDQKIIERAKEILESQKKPKKYTQKSLRKFERKNIISSLKRINKYSSPEAIQYRKEKAQSNIVSFFNTKAINNNINRIISTNQRINIKQKPEPKINRSGTIIITKTKKPIKFKSRIAKQIRSSSKLATKRKIRYVAKKLALQIKKQRPTATITQALQTTQQNRFPVIQNIFQKDKVILLERVKPRKRISRIKSRTVSKIKTRLKPYQVVLLAKLTKVAQKQKINTKQKLKLNNIKRIVKALALVTYLGIYRILLTLTKSLNH